MKRAEDFVPWKVTDISFRPYKGMWSMNPSIHYDGQIWRCVLRCTDYAMPGGKTIRSSKATPGEARTKNAMVIFDPTTWRPVEIYKMHEHDGLPRASSSSLGYEDMRLFRTDSGGLQGIAASLHLRREDRPRKQRAEQVVLSFDAKYDIVEARPIRGDAWRDTPQKNWSPFDDCAEPRFLYSIEEGTLLGDSGVLRSDLPARPSLGRRARTQPSPDDGARERARERAEECEVAQLRELRDQRRREGRERKRSEDLSSSTHGGSSLRGGTQIVRVGDDEWLGIGHAMKIVDDLKYYWHVWYLVDGRGKMRSASPPMKLAPNSGIEFAAGLGIDGERVVVSFGVDDMECRLGETRLSAVRSVLKSV